MYTDCGLVLMVDQSWFSSTITKTCLMWLLTVTATGPEAVAAPEASRARTASVWAPFETEKLSQVAAKGAAAALATTAPSSWYSTVAVPAGAEADRPTGPASTAPLETPVRAGTGVVTGGGSTGGVPTGGVGSVPAGLAVFPPHARTVAVARAASVRKVADALSERGCTGSPGEGSLENTPGSALIRATTQAPTRLGYASFAAAFALEVLIR